MKSKILKAGFLTLACSLSAAAQQEPPISLEELLDTRVVTAARYDQHVSEAPASVTIITAEEIRRYGFRTLADLLATLPGFYVSYDRNYTYIGVRGFSRPTDYNNRILVLIDGHPTNENFYGSAYAGTEMGLNLGVVERVEVVRGPGSSLYGTGAMFAVINIITNSGKSVDGLTVGGEAGNFGKVGAFGTYGRRFAEDIDLVVSGIFGDFKGRDLYFGEYDDPQSNYGISEDLDWDKFHGLQAKSSYKGVRVETYYAWRKKGVPTGAWEVLFNDANTNTLDERTFLALSDDIRLSESTVLALSASYDYYHYAGAYPYETGLSFDENNSHWVSVGSQFLWDLASNNRFIAGAGYVDNLRARFRWWDSQAVYFDGDYPSRIYSIYAQDEYQVLHNLAITVGLRSDRYSDLFEGGAVTPRAAVVYNPVKNSTVKLLYGEAYRAPNAYELNYRDEFAGYKANPSLGPERIRTGELVLEQVLAERLRCFASMYVNRINGLIDYEIDSTDSLIQFRNLGRAGAIGTEAGFTAHLSRGALGFASISYQRSRDLDTDGKLTNSPEWMAKGGLSWPLRMIGFFSADIRYESSRLTVYDTRTDDYILTNFHLGLEPGTWNMGRDAGLEHLEVVFSVNNALDVDYSTPGGYEHYQDRIMQDGRNFALKAQYHF